MARSILTGTGVFSSEAALKDRREKHQAIPLPVLPLQILDPQPTEEVEEVLAKTMSRGGLHKLAECAPPNCAPDQLG